MLDVWIDFCDVKMKSRYYLKLSKRHPNYMQLQQVTELNNRKNLEKTPCISSQRTILEQEYQNEKNVLKTTGSKTTLKLLIFLIFYAKQRKLKRWGKMVGQTVIPGNFKRGYRRSPYDSSFLYTLQSTSDVLTRSRFFQFGSFSQTGTISNT